LPIAVNVSAVEFRYKGFVEVARAVLLETGLEARYLELEVTEGVLMENAESVLQELKMMAAAQFAHLLQMGVAETVVH
jgi:EAL domain-containing protein (putative c-di-GMP-specific phosphodiesterase class I)